MHGGDGVLITSCDALISVYLSGGEGGEGLERAGGASDVLTLHSLKPASP